MIFSSEITFEDNFSLTQAQFKEAIEKACYILSIYAADDCADELLNEPRRYDTGRLFNSIDGQITAFGEVSIGTNVEYAMYVHDGTSKMAPNRFLRNGLMNNVDEYKEDVEKCLKGV